MFEDTRVTPKDLDEAIVGTTYTLLPDGRTTICQLTLFNGFTVMGKSACVSIENYRQDLGEKYSLEDARNNLWPVLGAILADRLHRERQASSGSWIARLREEYQQLERKTTRLLQFIRTDAYSALSTPVQEDLRDESRIMQLYAGCLRRRLARAEKENQ